MILALATILARVHKNEEYRTVHYTIDIIDYVTEIGNSSREQYRNT